MTYTTADLLEYGIRIGFLEGSDTCYSLSPRELRGLNAAYVDHLETQESIVRMNSMLDSLGMAQPEVA